MVAGCSRCHRFFPYEVDSSHIFNAQQRCRRSCFNKSANWCKLGRLFGEWQRTSRHFAIPKMIRHLRWKNQGWLCSRYMMIHRYRMIHIGIALTHSATESESTSSSCTSLTTLSLSKAEPLSTGNILAKHVGNIIFNYFMWTWSLGHMPQQKHSSIYFHQAFLLQVHHFSGGLEKPSPTTPSQIHVHLYLRHLCHLALAGQWGFSSSRCFSKFAPWTSTQRSGRGPSEGTKCSFWSRAFGYWWSCLCVKSRKMRPLAKNPGPPARPFSSCHSQKQWDQQWDKHE